MIVSPLGGNERRLAEPDAQFVSWLPDSSAVIIPRSRPGSDQYDLETVSLATGEHRRLNPVEQSVSGTQPFRFSPDGRWFAYCAHRAPAHSEEIFMRPAEGGPEIQLTHMGRSIQGWTWSPDSQEILFSSNLNGPFALWRVAAKAGAQPQMVLGTGEDAYFPVMARYAPSLLQKPSNILVYERWQRVLNLEARDILFDRGSGSRPARPPRAGPPRAVFPSTRDDHSPHLSPDGSRIVFISNRSGFDELWTGSIDQSEEPKLLTSFGPKGLHPLSPRWSPDGKQIVFAANGGTSSDPLESNSEIYVLPADGSGPARRLTAWQSQQQSPSWSTDGAWIYFSSDLSGTSQIWKLPANAPAANRQGANLNLAVQVTHRGGDQLFETAGAQTFLRRAGCCEGPILAQQPGADLDSAQPFLNVHVGDWWSPSRDGLFYVDTTRSGIKAFPAAVPKPIYFMDARTRRPTRIGEIHTRFFENRPDFSAAPDGSRIVYSQFVIKNIDLMMVRKFY